MDLSGVRYEIDRMQSEVDELESAAALVQQSINERALDLLLGTIADQAKRIHELERHVGSFAYCYAGPCVETRLLIAEAEKAART